MKTKRIKVVTGVFVLFILLASGLNTQIKDKQGGHGESEFPMNWRRYYNFDEMTDILKRMEKQYPGFVRLESSGKSRQGRDLWVTKLTNLRTGDFADKPAMYIDGNIHGNEVNGMMVPLYTLWYLLTRYNYDSHVKDLLDTKTFYIRPSVNVDGLHSFVTEANTPHHPRWNFRPVDNDGDGLCDEDPEEDINGDGEISYMRIKDPNGRWRQGEDPRVLVRCEPDEPPGGWRLIGWEGIDNDGDGRINEDIPGGVDMARNFPARWSFSTKTGHPYPLSEPETKAVADFFLAQKNISAVFHYHNMGKLMMLALGPIERRQVDLPREAPEDKVDRLMESLSGIQVPSERRGDFEIYRTLARRGAEILEYRPTSLGGVGQFPPWTYEHNGAYSILVELWRMPADFDGDGRVSVQEQMRWNDYELLGNEWLEWKPFKHPQLGDIEIGGTFKKFVTRCPPGRYLEEQLIKNCMFSLYVAGRLPQVEIEDVTVLPLNTFVSVSETRSEKTGEGTFEISADRSETTENASFAWIEVTLRNTGFMPTASQQAKIVKIAKPDAAIFTSSSNIELVIPEYKEKPVFSTDVKEGLAEAPVFGNRKVKIGNLDGWEAKKVRWFVKFRDKNPGWIEILSDSPKGGKDRKKIDISFR